MGVEVALNEPKMVRNPNIGEAIVNSYLREAFYQELYKHFAESQLKKQMKTIDQTATNFSESTLKRMYAKEPEYNIFFITIQHPINPTSEQRKEAKNRSEQIYAQVAKSKKPFLELISLYSDDKNNGNMAVNRSRASIFPSVYKRLKSMKNGQISRPIRVPFGYVIVKLNRKVPFAEANQTAIKANYFNTERTKIFNKYFDGLKQDFRVHVVNENIINTL